MSLYSYIPLEDRQIRILYLDPSGIGEPLKGNLVQVALQDPMLRPKINSKLQGDADETQSSSAKFEAISYVWGSSDTPGTVTTPSGTIAITLSLHSVLRRLRLRDTVRALWADAICINQHDTAEKERQITLMGDIYGTAEWVICDLGDATRDSDEALDLMERYWKKHIRKGWRYDECDSLSAEETAAFLGINLPSKEEADAIPDLPDNGDPVYSSVLNLMSRQWFRRLWVTQEFVLARQAYMLCGTRQLCWSQLLAGYLFYQGADFPYVGTSFTGEFLYRCVAQFIMTACLRAYRHLDPASAGGQVCHKVLTRFAGGSQQLVQAASSICFVLNFFTGFYTSIPRDRYFGLLSMMDNISDPFKADILPDYESPVEDIILRFGRAGLSQPQGAEMFMYAGIAGREKDVPSWTRDYTLGDVGQQLLFSNPLVSWLHRAAGDTPWRVLFDKDEKTTIHLTGYRVDEITEIARFDFDTEGAIDYDSLLQHLLNNIHFFVNENLILRAVDGRYHNGDHILDAAWKTVVCFAEPAASNLQIGFSYAHSQMIIQDNEDYIHDFPTQLSRIFSTDFVDVVESREDFVGETTSCLGMRSSKTKRGYFAAMPLQTLPGDEVWVISGCRLPVILRSSPKRPGSYEFVGAGYVHGFMQGEVVNNPAFKLRGVSIH